MRHMFIIVSDIVWVLMILFACHLTGYITPGVDDGNDEIGI